MIASVKKQTLVRSKIWLVGFWMVLRVDLGNHGLFGKVNIVSNVTSVG